MTNVHIVILGLLCKQQLHGYEIKQIIEERMNDWTDIKFGSIYFALAKLKDEGKVMIEKEERSSKRPTRKVYRVTKKGKQEFLRLLRILWAQKKQSLYPLDIAVFFMDRLPKQEVVKQINARIAVCEKELDSLGKHENEQMQNPHMPRQAFYIMDHSKMHMEAELNWLKKTAADMKREE